MSHSGEAQQAPPPEVLPLPIYEYLVYILVYQLSDINAYNEWHLTPMNFWVQITTSDIIFAYNYKYLHFWCKGILFIWTLEEHSAVCIILTIIHIYMYQSYVLCIKLQTFLYAVSFWFIGFNPQLFSYKSTFTSAIKHRISN